MIRIEVGRIAIWLQARSKEFLKRHYSIQVQYRKHVWEIILIWRQYSRCHFNWAEILETYGDFGGLAKTHAKQLYHVASFIVERAFSLDLADLSLIHPTL